MSSRLPRRFGTLTLGQQLVVLSATLDPIGFVAGYLLGPSLGLDPVTGAVVGIAIVTVPVALWASLGSH